MFARSSFSSAPFCGSTSRGAVSVYITPTDLSCVMISPTGVSNSVEVDLDGVRLGDAVL